MKNNMLYGSDILSVDQFNLQSIDLVMETANMMKDLIKNDGANNSLHGKIMTALFYEPSSRTFGSFITSMQRLGGGFIPLQGVTYSSVAKGETLADTVRTFASYSDVIVIRHPEVGSARIAADFSDKPVINAGDGVGEHPTQALLDFYTILERYGKISGLTITMVGDLLNGRTVHSLSKLLSLNPNITLNLISPEILRMPAQLIQILKDRNVKIIESETLDTVLPDTDVLYVTRVQKERFSDLDTYEKLKNKYIITGKSLDTLKKTSIVMHPFPRVGEIAMEVDLDERAYYINHQMVNGMYVRMALLRLILKKDIE
jgi:aspartate carbamoyltransferase catalytic subunit